MMGLLWTMLKECNGVNSMRVMGFIVLLCMSGWVQAVRFDVNGDGHADILWRHAKTGVNYLYQLQDLEVTQQALLNTVDPAWRLVGMGDFNHDGQSDLFWRHRTGANYIYLMNGKNILKRMPFVSIAPEWTLAAVADFNGDGTDDCYWRHMETGQNYLHLMGDGEIVQPIALSEIGPEWEVSGSGDFDGNQRADLLWHHRGTGARYMHLFMDNAEKQVRYLNTLSDRQWQVAAIADFNGDHVDDLLWRHQQMGLNYLYLMQGAAVMQHAAVNTVADTNWFIAASDDYNGDGMSDLLWRHHITGENVMYAMQGTAIDRIQSMNPVADKAWRVGHRREFKASPLQRVAEQLAAGEYAELDTGLEKSQITEGNISILTWSDSAGWDSLHRRIKMVCKRAGTYDHRHLTYHEMSNQWHMQVMSDVFGQSGHCYDGNTADGKGGIHYFLPYYSSNVRRLQQGKWDTLPDMPIPRVAAMSLSWVEHSQRGSGLLAVAGGTSGPAWFDPKTAQWDKLKEISNYPIEGVTWGSYHAISEYNPIQQITVIGGGNGANQVLYKMDHDFNFTLLQTTPVLMGARNSMVTVDPHSGHYLVYDFNNLAWWQFDALQDNWQLLDSKHAPPLFDMNVGALQVPVYEYGVIVFVTLVADTPKVYVYRG